MKASAKVREGVRGVACVALATPFFRFYFIKIVQKVLKKFVYYRLHQSEIPNALPVSKHRFKIGIDPPPTNQLPMHYIFKISNAFSAYIIMYSHNHPSINTTIITESSSRY